MHVHKFGGGASDGALKVGSPESMSLPLTVHWPICVCLIKVHTIKWLYYIYSITIISRIIIIIN